MEKEEELVKTYDDIESFTFLIVGGGIAGVSCAETIAMLCPEESILLLTESNIVKNITNLHTIARYLYKFNVIEHSINDSNFNKRIKFAVDQLQYIDSKKKQIKTHLSHTYNYQYLCLCTGALPNLIKQNNPRVIGIRDTDSVLSLQHYLRGATRIVLVGNGGIASELAYELSNIEVHWIIKDNHIASTFVDPGAANFFLQGKQTATGTPTKRMKYSEWKSYNDNLNENKTGAALGPDWQKHFKLCGTTASTNQMPIVHYKINVNEIVTETDCVKVILSSGEIIECDFIISATGVVPKHEYAIDSPLKYGTDNGILVDEMMQTNIPDIYAAGDVCTANWENAEHWFQMRLWTQARQMGAMAGRSMTASFRKEKISQDFCFELFGHVTELFGYQVVLLGRYNGNGLGSDYEILLRSTPQKEYVKFVIQRGRLRGAILIGDISLAETCENLILNAIDLTPFGDDILNPDIDIEDYFD